MRLRDKPYYRHMISKRAAVDSLIKIAEALDDDNYCYFMDYGFGNFDRAVYNLADNVRRLKEQADEYYKLKEALSPIIKGVCR